MSIAALTSEGAERKERSDRFRSTWRAAATLIVVAAIYEAFARSGMFPPALLPTLPKIFNTLVASLLDGSMLVHAASTLYRVLFGLGLAIVVAIPLGILMARFKPIEHFVLPLASALMPIPSLAWVPVFILWFGLGDAVTVAIVFYAGMFPMLLNTWTGVKAVKEIWVRSAQAMGADNRRLFRHVILPGALPYILTGLRLGLAQAWRILVGVEMLAAVSWGMGWMIFGAREFLNTDVMLAGVVVIAVIGLALEKLVFQRIEHLTVVRWGMLS